MKEEDTPFALLHRHAQVLHAGEPVLEAGKLVVVGGEKHLRRGAAPVGQVFQHGPGDAHAVVGGGSPPYFVQDHQAPVRDVVEDVGRLHHLNHEGAATPGEVVPGPYAGEDPVAQPDLRRLGRNEAPHLGQDHQKGGAPQVGGLPRHVRPGYQGDALPIPFQLHGVGNEGRIGEHILHHGVAAVLHHEVEAGVHCRPDVPLLPGSLRQGGQHVQDREGLTEGLEVLHPVQGFPDQPVVEFPLPPGDFGGG
ncbi:hypothetical protein SDC9_124973 [bioreactor metagenome]|uniref:Uncharacterized protein n=1 Tax=bioreactor metagenome TaxID=1076179 RepID=A0A645CLX9_9ZZZZ